MDSKSKSGFTSYTPTELKELYEKEPNFFTELADDAIRQACIGRTPEQTLKLRQLQWTIDGQLRKAKTPLGRMQIMENIFYSQVFGDDGHLAKLCFAYAELFRAINGADHVPSKKPGTCSLKK